MFGTAGMECLGDCFECSLHQPVLRNRMRQPGGALGTNQNATGRNTAKVMTSGVRRLMPIECERLQGILDDYTLIPWRGGTATDGHRYKAIGNGMAVPCVGWVLRKVHQAWERMRETMCA